MATTNIYSQGNTYNPRQGQNNSYNDYSGNNQWYFTAGWITMDVYNGTSNQNTININNKTNNSVTLKGTSGKFTIQNIGDDNTFYDQAGGIKFESSKVRGNFKLYKNNGSVRFNATSNNNKIYLLTGAKNNTVYGLGKTDLVQLDGSTELIIRESKNEGSTADAANRKKVEILGGSATIWDYSGGTSLNFKAGYSSSYSYQIFNNSSETIYIINGSNNLVEVSYSGLFSGSNFIRSLISSNITITNSGNTLRPTVNDLYVVDTAGLNTFNLKDRSMIINNRTNEFDTIKFQGGSFLRIQGDQGKFRLDNDNNSTNNTVRIEGDNIYFGANNSGLNILTWGLNNGARLWGTNTTHTIDEGRLVTSYNWSDIYGNNNTVNLNNAGWAWSTVMGGTGSNTININGTQGRARIQSGTNSTVNVGVDARNALVYLDAANNLAVIRGQLSYVESNYVNDRVQIYGSNNISAIYGNHGNNDSFSFTDILGGNNNRVEINGSGRAWVSVLNGAASNTVNLNRDDARVQITGGSDNTVNISTTTDNAEVSINSGERNKVIFNSGGSGNKINFGRDVTLDSFIVNGSLSGNIISREGFANLDYDVFGKLTTQIRNDIIDLNYNNVTYSFTGFDARSVKIGDGYIGNTVNYDGRYVGSGWTVDSGLGNRDNAFKVQNANINIKNGTNAHIFGSDNLISSYKNREGTVNGSFQSTTLDITGNNNKIQVGNNSTINVFGYGNTINNTAYSGGQRIVIDAFGTASATSLTNYSAMGSTDLINPLSDTRKAQLQVMYDAEKLQDIDSVTTRVQNAFSLASAAIKASNAVGVYIAGTDTPLSSGGLNFTEIDTYGEFLNTFFKHTSKSSDKVLLEFATYTSGKAIKLYYDSQGLNLSALNDYLTWYQANLSALPVTYYSDINHRADRGILQTIYENIVAARSFTTQAGNISTVTSVINFVLNWFTVNNNHAYFLDTNPSLGSYDTYLTNFKSSFTNLVSDNKTIRQLLGALLGQNNDGVGSGYLGSLGNQTLIDHGEYKNAGGGTVTFDTVFGSQIETFMQYASNGADLGLSYRTISYDNFSSALTDAYSDFLVNQIIFVKDAKLKLGQTVTVYEKKLSELRETAKINMILTACTAVLSFGAGFSKLKADELKYWAQFPTGAAAKVDPSWMYSFYADVLGTINTTIGTYKLDQSGNPGVLGDVTMNTRTGINEFINLGDFANGRQKLFNDAADSTIGILQNTYKNEFSALIKEMERITVVSKKDMSVVENYSFGYFDEPDYDYVSNWYNRLFCEHNVTGTDLDGDIINFSLTPVAPTVLTRSNYRDYSPEWSGSEGQYHAAGRYANLSVLSRVEVMDGYLSANLEWSVEQRAYQNSTTIKYGVIGRNLQ